MKKQLYIIAIFLSGLFLLGCEDYLEPEKDNRLTEEQLLSDPALAEGLLIKAYKDLPSAYTFDLDVASDDAVTNDFNSPYLHMATGQWSSQNSPASVWSYAYEMIFYLNAFIERKDQVVWSWQSDQVNDLHLQRLTGEAYGLRAWYEFLLLQHHAGKDEHGNMAGFPIVTSTIGVDDEWQLPRNTFEECVDQIISDCEEALKNLPDSYEDTGDANYDEAMGVRWTNRITGNAVKALKSRILLYAASPAYNPSSDAAKWEEAARAAGNFLQESGGLGALSPTGLTFYKYSNNNDADVIWARAIIQSTDLEADNFPPSLLGKGRTNPTQELVDAFPMANSYPVSDALSGYDPNEPYANRDPRLSQYILYDGNDLGAKGAIRTYQGAPLDGINVQTNSTRTGYYLKKFVLDNVNVENPEVEQPHFYTYARYTEIFLNYAEAANEAWGPDVDSEGYGFTARDVMAAIRQRAGIDQPDNYLASQTSKEQMQALIRNERRLELCFEGHRFWDIRRWNDTEAMKAQVNGAFITVNADNRSFDYRKVEDRGYKDHMIYGPLPYNEILKYEELAQNQGW